MRPRGAVRRPRDLLTRRARQHLAWAQQRPCRLGGPWVNRIRPTLPDNVEPTVFAGSTDDIPAIVLAASGGTDQTDLANRLDDTVVPELSAIEGVRDVQVTGTRSKQIVIAPRPAALASRATGSPAWVCGRR